MRPAGLVLAVILIAVPGFASDAQDSGNAVSPNAAIDRMVQNMLQHPESRAKFPAPPPKTLVTACSVPLLEMPLPQDKRFTMQQLMPRKDQPRPDVVPFSAMPAPPCSTKQN